MIQMLHTILSSGISLIPMAPATCDSLLLSIRGLRNLLPLREVSFHDHKIHINIVKAVNGIVTAQ